VRDGETRENAREVWIRNQWAREGKEIRKKKNKGNEKRKKGNKLCIFINCYSQIILSILLLDNNNKKIIDI
jgi:hypothetical protein